MPEYRTDKEKAWLKSMGKEIGGARKASGFTMREASRLLGKSIQSLEKLEYGVNFTCFKTLMKMEVLYKVKFQIIKNFKQ